MAGIVSSYTRHLHGPGCTHGELVVDLDGEQFTFQDDERDLAEMEFDKRRFVRDSIYYWHVERGVPLDQIAGRVCLGEEATNVKVYSIIAKDVTRTNVGTAYRDVANGANGERKFVDFTGCTEFRARLWANLVGTGPFGFRLIRDGDSAVLYENASVALTGERELDPGWLPIPQGFAGETLLRLQIKSAVAADDPLIRGCDLGVR